MTWTSVNTTRAESETLLVFSALPILNQNKRISSGKLSKRELADISGFF
jgi:hypothetical protein